MVMIELFNSLVNHSHKASLPDFPKGRQPSPLANVQTLSAYSRCQKKSDQIPR